MLRPGQSPAFRADFLAARYDRCLAAVRGDGDLEETLLAVTALRRLDRETDALALLAIVEEDVVGSGDDLRCGRFCTQRAAALASARDPAAGRSFGLARAFLLRAETAHAPAALAELAYQEALAAWNGGDRTLATATLERAAPNASLETRAWTRLLGAEIAASDLDFDRQLDAVHATLRELAASDERDVWLEAVTLQALARVATERDERRVATFVRGRADALAWTSATSAMEHDVFHRLGWYESLRGDVAESRALSARAARCAPGDRERVRSLVDEAHAARAAAAPGARERLDAAAALAETVDWSVASFAVLEPLLELAALLAGSDPQRSLDLTARYRETRRFSMNLSHQQPISVARERYWFGAGALDRGERSVARGHLQHAFDFWSTVRFAPRAALAAIGLCALGPHPGARDFLGSNRGTWPGSALNERIAATLDA